MGEFTMPSLGADMDAGTVSEWLVHPGDRVRRGDIVAVVETDKSTIEVEVFEDGVVESLLVEPGLRVPVGTPLARITSAAPAPAAVRVRSPVVRHLATELGVDLAAVTGTGPGGTVTRLDVERAAAPLPAPGAPGTPAPPGTPGPPAPTVVRPEAAGPAGDGARGPEEAPSRRRGTGRRRHRAPGTVAPRTAGPRPAHRVAAGPRSSPRARQLAAELGVDLTSLVGSGPGGAVVGRDVEAAACSPAPPARHATPAAPAAPAPVVGAPGAPGPPGLPLEPGAAATDGRTARLRQAIGALMARSKREVPHYYLTTTVDVGAATAWLAETNRTRSVEDRLVLPALLVKATALAVAAVPEVNGYYVDGAFAPSAAVHVGVAVSLRPAGVVAPALHDVEQRSLDEVMAGLRDLVTRARSGHLRGSEMSDPTITVTNLGELGVDTVLGVIYPPQVALVGFGRVSERAVALDGLVGARPCLTASLSADHRVSDGHRGGRFLAEVDRLLQQPDAL